MTASPMPRSDAYLMMIGWEMRQCHPRSEFEIWAPEEISDYYGSFHPWH